MDLAARIYELTKYFPKDGLFGLAFQMRIASVSVPSNIAEGGFNHHITEFRQFIYLATGSLAELETKLLIALRARLVNISSAKDLGNDINTLGRMPVSPAKKLGGKC